MNEIQQEQARKIAALLAKAESTEHQGERDLYIEKATMLQFKYAIDEAMLANAGQKVSDTISSIRLCEERNTPLIKAKRELATGLAFANRSRPFLGYKRRYIEIIGFESDLRFIQVLYTSLLLQMQTEMARDEAAYQPYEPKSWRVSYGHSYVRRVLARIHEANRAAKQEVDSSAPGTSLVLASKAALVDKHIEDAFGPVGKGKRIPTNANGSVGGMMAGRAAADRASLGDKGLGGHRAAIG